MSAVDLLVAARRSRRWIDALPASAKPGTLAEAHDIQDATAAALGDRIAGWKVAIGTGEVMRGAIFRSVTHASPASVTAADVPQCGIEGEIAFRFNQGLTPREHDYTRAEIEAAVTAFAAIEIVASRFVSYTDTPLLDRTADCMSNGAFVAGTPRDDWRNIDLAALEAVLVINGAVVVQKTGGHATKDPILPAIALVNAMRQAGGIAAGQFITTGTYTGLHFAKPGDEVEIRFTGFGEARVTLAP